MFVSHRKENGTEAKRVESTNDVSTDHSNLSMIYIDLLNRTQLKHRVMLVLNHKEDYMSVVHKTYC